MKNLPFDTFGLTENQVKELIGIMVTVQEQYHCVPEEDFGFPLDNFTLSKDYKHIHQSVTYQTTQNVFLSISEVHTLERVSNKNGNITHIEQQLWGFARLSKDFGHLILRPETFFDKINELLKPVEIDFEEDRKFSDKIYLLADDEKKTRSLVNQEFRTLVTNLQNKNYILEIVGNQAVITSPGQTNASTAIGFAEFLRQLVALN